MGKKRTKMSIMGYAGVPELWVMVIFFYFINSPCRQQWVSPVTTCILWYHLYHMTIKTIGDQSCGGARPYLVTIMHSGDNLPEEVSGLPLAEASPLADVIIQLPLACVLHDDHNLIFVLKHCGGDSNTQNPVYPTSPLMAPEGTRGDNGDVTEQGPRATGQDTSQAIPRQEELGECSSQVDNDITALVTGHTLATLRGRCLSFLRAPHPSPRSLS